MFTHRCPKCGRFTGQQMMHAHWALGEQTGMEYIYCDAACYEAMEFPYYLQEQNYQEE